MGGVFNLIKKLFSGILSFIGGILGGNKSGYYMEAEPLPAKSAAKVEESKTEDAKSAVATVKATVNSAADSVTEGVKEVAETTEATAKTAAKSVKAKATKVESVTAEKAETNGSPNGAKPPVPADTLNLPQPTTSFATEYLVPKPTNTRRRPGANMNSYLEMAKTVKTPNN
ncbi:hypothetical protein ACQ4M3_11710 [Leptolyngbya sp. AN03gr2]|uniref:hypothetical protein n=1 Tax=unclassified Leptolyngbya TaxID=2650499 RepID=UPI003D30F0F2